MGLARINPVPAGSLPGQLTVNSCRKAHCNPDNIATPIAASLGDVVTLGLLAWISDVLYTDFLLGQWRKVTTSCQLGNPTATATVLY